MPKTIAELSQELKDAGRDVRMAGEMVERLCDGTQDFALVTDALAAVDDARLRTLVATLTLEHERKRESRQAHVEAAK